MKTTTMRTLRASALGILVFAAFLHFVTPLFAVERLEIDKAVCGAEDSWCDVTAFMQNSVSGDTLSATIAQPFEEIGGDPAPGQGKTLIIDYRLNGVLYRLSLQEQYPVAFTITLPSADAVPPGNDPLPTASSVAPWVGPQSSAPIANARANVASNGVGPRWALCLSLFACGVSLVAIAGAAVAVTQVRRIKKQLNGS